METPPSDPRAPQPYEKICTLVGYPLAAIGFDPSTFDVWHRRLLRLADLVGTWPDDAVGADCAILTRAILDLAEGARLIALKLNVKRGSQLLARGTQLLALARSIPAESHAEDDIPSLDESGAAAR